MSIATNIVPRYDCVLLYVEKKTRKRKEEQRDKQNNTKYNKDENHRKFVSD